MTFYQAFANFSKKFTQTVHKVTVEICPNFYSSLLKIFFCKFPKCFKSFFDSQIIFLKKLSVISSVLILILCFIKLFTNIPVFSEFVPKFPKFYLKFCQTYLKFLKNILYLFSICIFSNLKKILINYLEIGLILLIINPKFSQKVSKFFPNIPKILFKIYFKFLINFILDLYKIL